MQGFRMILAAPEPTGCLCRLLDRSINDHWYHDDEDWTTLICYPSIIMAEILLGVVEEQ